MISNVNETDHQRRVVVQEIHSRISDRPADFARGCPSSFAGNLRRPAFRECSERAEVRGVEGARETACFIS